MHSGDVFSITSMHVNTWEDADEGGPAVSLSVAEHLSKQDSARDEERTFLVPQKWVWLWLPEQCPLPPRSRNFGFCELVLYHIPLPNWGFTVESAAAVIRGNRAFKGKGFKITETSVRKITGSQYKKVV